MFLSRRRFSLELVTHWGRGREWERRWGLHIGDRCALFTSPLNIIGFTHVADQPLSKFWHGLEARQRNKDRSSKWRSEAAEHKVGVRWPARSQSLCGIRWPAGSPSLCGIRWPAGSPSLSLFAALCQSSYPYSCLCASTGALYSLVVNSVRVSTGASACSLAPTFVLLYANSLVSFFLTVSFVTRASILSSLNLCPCLHRRVYIHSFFHAVRFSVGLFVPLFSRARACFSRYDFWFYSLQVHACCCRYVCLLSLSRARLLLWVRLFVLFLLSLLPSVRLFVPLLSSVRMRLAVRLFVPFHSSVRARFHLCEFSFSWLLVRTRASVRTIVDFSLWVRARVPSSACACFWWCAFPFSCFNCAVHSLAFRGGWGASPSCPSLCNPRAFFVTIARLVCICFPCTVCLRFSDQSRFLGTRLPSPGLGLGFGLWLG